jgi:hypothetical protein
MPGTAAAEEGVWGGCLSKKPFQKELAMHRLTFDPGQCWVLLLVHYKIMLRLLTFFQTLRFVFVFFRLPLKRKNVLPSTAVLMLCVTLINFLPTAMNVSVLLALVSSSIDQSQTVNFSLDNEQQNILEAKDAERTVNAKVN